MRNTRRRLSRDKGKLKRPRVEECKGKDNTVTASKLKEEKVREGINGKRKQR